MTIGVHTKQTIAEQISSVREFNRFYTARLGLLRQRHLNSEFSLTEGRILYELGAYPRRTASSLRSTLELDRGYISRILTAMSRQKLVRQMPSKEDGREKQLILTTLGKKALVQLNARSTMQLQEMLSSIDAADRKVLVASLQRVKEILSESQKVTVRIERLTSIGEEALGILSEYYEAVHVVQRDSSKSIQEIVEEPASGIWLAYLKDKAAGCVVLRSLPQIIDACECKRLYVKPAARGNRIADQLLDAQEEFARNHGIKWIYLDSYNDLKDAISLYERRGYQYCERYNDNPQATLFMRKRIG